MLEDFYRENPTDQIWWTSDIEEIGSPMFSFDKKEIFRLFGDYPHKLTKEQKEIFDRENPFWRDFFADSSEDKSR